MSKLWAVVIDLFITHSVHILNILPPLIFFAILWNNFPKALLAEILNQNVLPHNISALVIHGTVAPIWQAFLSFELCVTASASPCYDLWSELRFFTHELEILAEVPHKVQGLIIGRSVPQFPVHFVILVFHDELSGKRSLSCDLWWLLGQEILQDLSLFLTNQHCGDSDASAGAIIRHDYLINIFKWVINYDSQAAASALNISNLGHESAVTTVDQENGSQDAIRVAGEVICEVSTSASISIRGVVIDSPYLNIDVIFDDYLP